MQARTDCANGHLRDATLLYDQLVHEPEDVAGTGRHIDHTARSSLDLTPSLTSVQFY